MRTDVCVAPCSLFGSVQGQVSNSSSGYSCWAGMKISCIMQVDAVDFTNGLIPLDTTNFATRFFLRKQCIGYSWFSYQLYPETQIRARNLSSNWAVQDQPVSRNGFSNFLLDLSLHLQWELIMKVIPYSWDKANLHAKFCESLTSNYKNVSVLFIFNFYPINVFVLCISGYVLITLFLPLFIWMEISNL